MKDFEFINSNKTLSQDLLTINNVNYIIYLGCYLYIITFYSFIYESQRFFSFKIENDIGECILWQTILCCIKIELK